MYIYHGELFFAVDAIALVVGNIAANQMAYVLSGRIQAAHKGVYGALRHIAASPLVARVFRLLNSLRSQKPTDQSCVRRAIYRHHRFAQRPRQSQWRSGGAGWRHSARQSYAAAHLDGLQTRRAVALVRRNPARTTGKTSRPWLRLWVAGATCGLPGRGGAQKPSERGRLRA